MVLGRWRLKEAWWWRVISYVVMCWAAFLQAIDGALLTHRLIDLKKMYLACFFAVEGACSQQWGYTFAFNQDHHRTRQVCGGWWFCILNKETIRCKCWLIYLIVNWKNRLTVEWVNWMQRVSRRRRLLSILHNFTDLLKYSSTSW